MQEQYLTTRHQLQSEILYIRLQYLIDSCSLDGLKSISKINFQTFIQSIQAQQINHTFSRTIVCVIVKNKQPSKLENLIWCEGITSVFQVFCLAHIYTNTDAVLIQVEDQVEQETLEKLVYYVFEGVNAKLMHSNIFQLKVPKMMVDQTQKCYTLITGGSRGIGKEISRCLAKQNKNLIITAREKTAYLQEFAEELRKQYKIEVIAAKLNLLEAETCSALAETLKAAAVTLNEVVHNAAVGSKTCFEQTHGGETGEEILMKVNLIGQMKLQSTLQNYHLFAKSTTIMIVSSVMANRPAKQMNPTDTASKTCLHPWANQLRKSFNVIIVYPGATDTDMFQKSTTNKLGDKKEQFYALLPKKRINTPQEMARIVALALDENLKGSLDGNKIVASCGMNIDFQN